VNAQPSFFDEQEPSRKVIQPRHGTRQALVLAYLQARPGQWIDGFALAAPEVGGSEGLKRLRELRAAGFPIEKRPKPHSDAWQYRLA
jgi:hypothetical protein